MTSREKVIEAERQVRAIVAGDGVVTKFHCPFCVCTSTEENEILCCNEAAEVVNAVLDHLEHIERTEIVERTLERFDKQRSALVN